MPNTKQDIDIQYTKLVAGLGQEVLKTFAAISEVMQRVSALQKERTELDAQENKNVQEKAKDSNEAGSTQEASSPISVVK